MSQLSRFLPGTVTLTFCAGVLLTACDPAPGARGGDARDVESRDSAGVRIVMNRVPPSGFPAFATVAGTPELRVGGAGGDVALSDVAGAVTLPDGGVAVAEASSGRIRFFGAGGGVRSEVDGVADEGVRRASRMGWVGGDTVWVADHRAGRLSTVTPDGVVATHAFPEGLTVAGRFADGSYLLIPAWNAALLTEGVDEGVRRDPATWARWSPTEIAAEHVGDFLHDEIMVVQGPEGPVAGVPPFGRRTAHAVGPEGFYQGDAETFEVRLHRSDGTLARIIRLSGVDLTLTEELKSSVRPPPAEGAPSLVDRFWEGVPDSRPAYTRFLVDRGGRLWVAEHVAGTAPARSWLVFDADGGASGLVVLPGGFSLLEAGEGYVLGVTGGEDGEGVVRYALERRE